MDVFLKPENLRDLQKYLKLSNEKFKHYLDIFIDSIIKTKDYNGLNRQFIEMVSTPYVERHDFLEYAQPIQYGYMPPRKVEVTSWDDHAKQLGDALYSHSDLRGMKIRQKKEQDTGLMFKRNPY